MLQSKPNWRSRINRRPHLKFRLFVKQNYHKSWKQKYFPLHFFLLFFTCFFVFFFLKKSFECLLWGRVVGFVDRKQYNCLFFFHSSHGLGYRITYRATIKKSRLLRYDVQCSFEMCHHLKTINAGCIHISPCLSLRFNESKMESRIEKLEKKKRRLRP